MQRRTGLRLPGLTHSPACALSPDAGGWRATWLGSRRWRPGDDGTTRRVAFCAFVQSRLNTGLTHKLRCLVPV